ncbi:cyclase/dehydrase [Xylaria flabelliformis]|nr:cyclase/dehydrase [Xylaria flabelliformis]
MPPTGFLPRPRPRIPQFASSPIQRQRRTFLNSLLSSSPLPPQILTASRRLPYNHAALYAIIADIDSYSAFLPYCSTSRVTAWTAHEDPEFGRRWPTRADLTAGWGGLEQTYTSRVFCVPGSIVEALSGEGARSGIAPDVLARYGLRDDESSPSIPAGSGSGGEEGVFKTLVTRWTVTPAGPDGRGEDAVVRTGREGDWSDVSLNIRFQFANPIYGAVSSAVADKVAPIMIEAFVERAKKVLG